jgi:hypothetical protein
MADVRAWKHARDLASLGRIDIARRLTGHAILCGDCGPSEMLRDGNCAGCAGRGWIPRGRGWLFTFPAGSRVPTIVAVGGSRLRLTVAPHEGRLLPVEADLALAS